MYIASLVSLVSGKLKQKEGMKCCGPGKEEYLSVWRGYFLLDNYIYGSLAGWMRYDSGLWTQSNARVAQMDNLSMMRMTIDEEDV